MGYYLMYLRKSRADAEKERVGRYETLAVHERALTELARREGYRVEEVYRELVSGESIDARPEYKRLMERISDPECEGVIAHAIDRLGRGDPMEYGWILSSFKWTHTRIVTPGRVYDPDDPSDAQHLKLQMFVGNIELEHIRERMKAGSVMSAERGNYLGSKPPYGYDKVFGKPEIVPSEAEAPVARMIFEAAASGSNKGAIARTLNEAGIRTRHGGTWTSSRISAILSNPVYKGMVRYGYRRARVVSRDGLRFVRKVTTSAEGEYVLAKGRHEPLVDEETWGKAQGAFVSSPVPNDMTLKNPLAGLIFCGKCGRAMIRQVVTNKEKKRYPRLRHVYDNGCRCRSANVSDIVEALCSALESIAEEVESGARAVGADRDEIAALERAVAEEGRRLDKLLELFYADAVSLSEFKERRDASKQAADRMEAKLAELRGRDVDPVEFVYTAREAVGLLRDESADASAKNDALRSFVERIDYWREDRRGGRIILSVRLRGID